MIKMKTYKVNEWRNCNNCIFNQMCNKKNKINCLNHIYNADPKRYGDINELLEPIFNWINIHYPNDTKMIIDRTSATLLIEHKEYFSKEITKILNKGV